MYNDIKKQSWKIIEQIILMVVIIKSSHAFLVNVIAIKN